MGDTAGAKCRTEIGIPLGPAFIFNIHFLFRLSRMLSVLLESHKEHLCHEKNSQTWHGTCKLCQGLGAGGDLSLSI